jgi:hypothetical protein
VDNNVCVILEVLNFNFNFYSYIIIKKRISPDHAFFFFFFFFNNDRMEFNCMPLRNKIGLQLT